VRYWLGDLGLLSRLAICCYILDRSLLHSPMPSLEAFDFPRDPSQTQESGNFFIGAFIIEIIVIRICHEF
jgi:hypothetical protein